MICYPICCCCLTTGFVCFLFANIIELILQLHVCWYYMCGFLWLFVAMWRVVEWSGISFLIHPLMTGKHSADLPPSQSTASSTYFTPWCIAV